MATNDKTDALFTEYKRGQYPQLEDGIRRYIQDELQRIEISLQSAASTTVQVVDKPPQTPLKGHIRFAVSPWDPLGPVIAAWLSTMAITGAKSRLFRINYNVWINT